MEKQKRMERGTFNLAEAATFAGVSTPTLATWVRRADFPAVKAGRRWVIPRAAFVSWLEEKARKRTEL